MVVGAAYLVGAVPLTQVAARLLRDVDLRTVGNGTVSGTGLYEVTGFGPLAAIGILEVAKGALGPGLAGRDRPYLAATAAGAGVAGHNWSPFVGMAGGRGISPAMGGALVTGPEGAGWLAAGLLIGRLAGETALGCFAAIVSLPVAMAVRRGRAGLAAGLALSVPMLIKRVMGNGPAPGPDRIRTYLWRLIVDRDSRQPPPRPAGGD